MVAAEGRHVETVVALIKHGANVNLKGWVSYWSQQLLIEVHCKLDPYKGWKNCPYGGC